MSRGGPFGGRAVITGAGKSQVGRRLGRTGLELTVEACLRAIEDAGLTVDDIDLFEINEAFASVPLVWMKELGVSSERLNVNGGAIALGHPLGASGARIMTTMLHELERRGGRYALQAICCAGGMGTATLIERL